MPAVLDSVCLVPLPNDVTTFYVAFLIWVNSPNGNVPLAFLFFLLDIPWERLELNSSTLMPTDVCREIQKSQLNY